MTYWELEQEPWEEHEDNYDGAHWMTIRGRIQTLEKLYTLEYSQSDTD